MIKGLKYAGTIFLSILFLTSVAAAQGNYGGSTKAREHGYQHGYRDGLRQGRADLKSNVRYSYESEDYRNADLGYEEYMGDRQDFQRGYREGYKGGYDDGYNDRPVRSDVYGVNGDSYDPDRAPRREGDADSYQDWGYADVAMDTGYRDGLSAGQKDLHDRKDYRPEKHDAYEDGDHGYRKNYGDKKLYKEQYRKGFLRGYEDAFHAKGR